MPLYTKSGDDGTTGLFGADRVGKDHPRVEAYGSVDELNACLGLAAAACPASGAFADRVLEILTTLQSRAFDLGADLATPQGSEHEDKIRRLTPEDVEQVEAWIDAIDGENEPMQNFVLPGGTELAARLHVARTVCRRAERRVVNLARAVDVNRRAIEFLNRLSDLLFAMARRANKEHGVPDVEWKKRNPI